jgi:cytochrome b561
MRTGNTVLRYGSVAMSLHWLIAALVIANLCLGEYFTGLPRHDPRLFALVQVHKSIGLTVLVLSLARLAWRLINPVPPLPIAMHPALRVLARATHVLLYVLIIVIPLSGWAMVSASPLGLPTMYFGLFQWPHIPLLAHLSRVQKVPLSHNLMAVHATLATFAIGLIVIHVGGALYHQLLRRDDVLKRMLPGTRISKLA